MLEHVGLLVIAGQLPVGNGELLLGQVAAGAQGVAFVEVVQGLHVVLHIK